MGKSSQLKIAVVLTKILSKYMWLSRVDMEHYSVVYFIALLRLQRNFHYGWCCEYLIGLHSMYELHP